MYHNIIQIYPLLTFLFRKDKTKKGKCKIFEVYFCLFATFNDLNYYLCNISYYTNKNILYMKKLLFLIFLSLFSVSNVMGQNDSTAFSGYLYNDEYQVYLKIDFYDSSISVPGQDIFGKLPGYFGAKRDTRLWLITDAIIEKDTKATLSIINDYGSEDLTAELSVNRDGTYTLKQKEGSRLKIVVNRKWVKIPKELTLLKK